MYGLGNYLITLLAKWWWGFNNERNALWAKVVSKKYNYDASFWFPQIPGSAPCSNLWKDICSVADLNSSFGLLIQQGFSIKVDDGRNTKFWEHEQIGGSNLQIEFPRLFLLSVQKECFAS